MGKVGALGEWERGVNKVDRIGQAHGHFRLRAVLSKDSHRIGTRSRASRGKISSLSVYFSVGLCLRASQLRAKKRRHVFH